MACRDVTEGMSQLSCDDVDMVDAAISQRPPPDYSKYTVKQVTGGRGGGADQFSCPYGVAVGSDGHIILSSVDENNHRIKIYDKNLSKRLSVFGTGGRGVGQFHYPAGVAVSTDGKVYVSECGNHRIQVLTMAGHDVVTCDVLEVNGMKSPWGLAFDTIGNLYICDRDHYRVQVLQPDGTHVRTIGSKGGRRGQFRRQILYVAVTQDQKVLVSEHASNVIKVFDTDGEFIATYPKKVPAALRNMNPWGLAVDHVGNIIIADHVGRVVVLNKDGRYVCTIGSPGNGPGQLMEPMGIAIDADGNIILTDHGNNTLNICTHCTG